jgi:hypothetical protein
MKRSHLNLLVDAASFVAFLLLLSTGLVLRYQLPPGSGELEGQGSGPGAANRVVTFLWGQTRHDWGAIHFWIAVTLVAVLALHLFLHWKWIVCMVRGVNSEASGWRFGLGLASLLALVVLAAVPLAAPTDHATRQQLLQATSQQGLDAADGNQLRGSMTLAEAAAETGVTVEYLRDQLGLDHDALPDERIGPLLRDSGKRMSDLRRLLATPTEPAAPNDKEITP